jgi:hypothetical protein
MRPADKFGQMKKEPMGGQNELYNQIANTPGTPEDISSFEADAAIKRNELLYNIRNQMEETQGMVKQEEQRLERLRQHLRELEEIYRTLTKGKGKEK